MQIARMDLTQVGNKSLKLASWRKRVEQRVLICGNVLAYGLHGACVAPGAPHGAGAQGPHGLRPRAHVRLGAPSPPYVE
jgi:hypothetical protein